MTLQLLREECRKALKTHPEKRAAIVDIYEYARDEIQDGESEGLECSHALSDLQELLNEKTKD